MAIAYVTVRSEFANYQGCRPKKEVGRLYSKPA